MTNGDWLKPVDALDAEDLERMKALAEKMPTRMRQVVTLRKVYGYTQVEIARRLGLTLEQVEEEIGNAVNFMAEKDIPDGQ